MCHLLNFKKIKKKKRLIITHATNKVIINLKLTKCNNLFTKLIKKNIFFQLLYSQYQRSSLSCKVVGNIIAEAEA